MPKNQAVTPNAGIISNNNGFCGVDKGHLHDLTISAKYELGIRELQAPHKNLFVYFAAITDAFIVYPWEVDRNMKGMYFSGL